MATTVQTSSSSYPPPPSFSQESTTSSVNGYHRSNSAMQSFEATQSSATTPTPTPPASRQQPLSYNFPNVNGASSVYAPSRSFQDNRQSGPPPSYPPIEKPQIYTAVYSNVQVYEMEVNGLAVMKRRNDSHMNATQILKLAGVEKGKRTKVLEKEILTGEHEKVQGGYGKYQGTWISYARAIEFARGYGVLELLKPLLEYDQGQDGISAGGDLNTPTKEQAMAAQRKRNLLNGANDRISGQSPNGTFFKNISKSAANAVNAINKARFDSPAPRPASRPQNFRRPSQQLPDSQEYQGSSQQSMQSLHSERSFQQSSLDPALHRHEGPYYGHEMTNGEEPPRKRVKASFSQDTTTDLYDTQMTDAPTTHPSMYAADSQMEVDIAIHGMPPVMQPTNTVGIEKQQLLSSLFFDSSVMDFSEHAALVKLSGDDLDIPIDTTGHTALHWASTLARTSLARALVQKGASIYRTNNGGETALIRAALTTNNLDQGSFPELLELLGPTIEIRDRRNRTVLHHIAVSSAVKGPKRSQASRYYLESLLEYIVRSGSNPSSQANSFHEPKANPQGPLIINLRRFMSDLVNADDMSGDTALNLAARVGNKSIIQQLLEVGADASIPNRGGLRPMDFGVTGDIPPTAGPGRDGQDSQMTDAASAAKKSQHVEASEDTINAFQAFLNTSTASFTARLREQQSLITSAQTQLRTTTASLSTERARLITLRQKADKRTKLRQRITKLKLANEEMKAELLRAAPETKEPDNDVKIGQADLGLEIDTTILPITLRVGAAASPHANTAATAPLAAPLTTEQTNYANKQLPSAAVLKARTAVYRTLNSRLEAETVGLKNRSREFEDTLREVVALCTGCEVAKVDEMVEGLGRAVGNEEGVEVGRVREFLRKVEGGVV